MNLVQDSSTKSKAGHFLDSLEIRGFRVFNHLILEHLGNVNLIVGKNNVGKSCILEALYLYAERGATEVMLRLLDARNEGVLRRYGSAVEEEATTLTTKYLFHGRPNLPEITAPIQIGEVNHPETNLSIEIGWYVEDRSAEGGPRLIKFDQLNLQSTLFADMEVVDLTPRLSIKWGQTNPRLISLYRRSYRRPTIERPLDALSSTYVPAQGLNYGQVSRMWDEITLTSLETNVVDALRIIHPNLEAINIVGSDGISGSERLAERSVIARLKGVNEPVPLRSLGEGMNRLLGIVLALVNARNGILLIDEIESGLHYSVQHEIWRSIFRTARQLNVQVFATTHSWDCIEAFQAAASEDTEQEGLLIRLQEKNGSIVPTMFDERRLAIATREQIEIR